MNRVSCPKRRVSKRCLAFEQKRRGLGPRQRFKSHRVEGVYMRKRYERVLLPSCGNGIWMVRYQVVKKLEEVIPLLMEADPLHDNDWLLFLHMRQSTKFLGLKQRMMQFALGRKGRSAR